MKKTEYKKHIITHSDVTQFMIEPSDLAEIHKHGSDMKADAEIKLDGSIIVTITTFRKEGVEPF